MSNELETVNTFSTDIYSRTSLSAKRFHECTSIMFHELLGRLQFPEHGPDVVLCPTSDSVLIAALARYLELAQPSQMPDVILWFVLPPRVGKLVKDQSSNFETRYKNELKESMQALRTVIEPSGSIRIFCETANMARYYSEAMGSPVDIMPGPNTAMYRDTKGTRNRGAEVGPGTPTFVALGHFSPRKGYELLSEAIQIVVSSGIASRFIIHCVDASPGPLVPGYLPPAGLFSRENRSDDRCVVRGGHTALCCNQRISSCCPMTP